MAQSIPKGSGDSITVQTELSSREELFRSSRADTMRRFYRPELDIIRFLAFFLVFLHHLLGFQGRLSQIVGQIGALGMCLFFFLSSYLITELLQREKQVTGRVHFQAFYIRRMLRIWPLYFAFIGLGVVIGRVQPSMALSSGFVLSFLLLAGNWYIGHVGMPNSPVSILWSISLEEQFYLLWPVLQHFLTRKWMCAVSLMLLPVGSYAVWMLHTSGADPGVKIWTNTFVHGQFFAMGALLSLFMNSRLPTLGLASRIVTILAGAALWIFSVVGLQLQQAGASGFDMVAGYMLVAVGCVLIVGGALGTSQKYLPGPIVYLGKISYGLYVFHLLCQFIAVQVFHWLASQNEIFKHDNLGMRIGKDTFALGLTIAMAVASYRLFESPFLRLKERFTFVHSRRV